MLRSDAVSRGHCHKILPEASLPHYLLTEPVRTPGSAAGGGHSTPSQAAPSFWLGVSTAGTCSVSPASYSLSDHLQREASAPALPRFSKITLYLQTTLPPPSKTSCSTPTSVLLQIFLVRHLHSLPSCQPMYNQTFSSGFLLYIHGGDISHGCVMAPTCTEPATCATPCFGRASEHARGR